VFLDESTAWNPESPPTNQKPKKQYRAITSAAGSAPTAVPMSVGGSPGFPLRASWASLDQQTTWTATQRAVAEETKSRKKR